MASEYPYMRTRLLLPETAVPVQDDGKQSVHEYNWEHHDWEHHEHDIGEHQGHEQDD